jgi:hypothetical protein
LTAMELVVGLVCVVPAERLIERAGSDKIGDAKRHKADALVHAKILAGVTGCAPCQGEPAIG